MILGGTMTYKSFLDKWSNIASEKGKEESAILLLFLSVAKISSSELYIKNG